MSYIVFDRFWALSFESLYLRTEANIFLKLNLKPYTRANHVKISEICGALSRRYLLTFLESIVFKSAQTISLKAVPRKNIALHWIINVLLIDLVNAKGLRNGVWVYKHPHQIGYMRIREASLNMKWSRHRSWSNGCSSLLKLTTCIYPESLSKLSTCYEEDIYDIQACSNPSIKQILQGAGFCVTDKRTNRH